VGKRREDTERRYAMCPAVSEGHGGVREGYGWGLRVPSHVCCICVCACARVSLLMYNTSAPSAGAMRKWTKWAKKSKGNQTLHPALSLAQERPTWLISASPQLTGMWYMNRLQPGGPDLFCCAPPPPPIPTIPANNKK
jgi:hypothetical protein